jgi:hypothetical protein
VSETKERPGNVGDRISSITAAVKPIVATGNNQFDRDKKALSVMDIEEALRPLLAEFGVVVNWSITNAALLEPQKLWRLDFHVTVFASGDPDDKLEAEWMDIGTSPSAAASFAVKGYYRRLFHLAEAEDDLQTVTTVAAKKPATLRRYANEIKKTWGPEPQVAQGEEPLREEPASPDLDLTDLFALARTLRNPATNLQVKNEVAEHGLEGVRRRLIMAHARDCNSPACEHVVALSGLAGSK